MHRFCISFDVHSKTEVHQINEDYDQSFPKINTKPELIEKFMKTLNPNFMIILHNEKYIRHVITM